MNLDPGPLILCPVNALCQPGPYNVHITAAMVGATVTSPNGIAAGEGKTVRAVENGDGTVLAGEQNEDLKDFHTASLTIVTPCLQAVTICDYPGPTACSPAGAAITFTGYVTNCGDIQMTNVVVTNSRAAHLLSATAPFLPLPMPLTLAPGQAITFRGSYEPTLAETCAGSASITTTVRGTDISAIGGPNASVTNTSTSTCLICVNPCLTVTKNCDSVVLGSPNTVSGVVSNCGNIAITNLVISDNLYGLLATIPSLGAGAFQAYSVLVTNRTCGSFQNIVTAAGRTVCGAAISAHATSTCVVIEAPCLLLTADCAPVIAGAPSPLTGEVSNCGNVPLTNVVVSSSVYGPVASFAVLAPGATSSYTTLVTNACGSFPNTMTATGRSTCGTQVSAMATTTCVVRENPCLIVTANCSSVLIPGTNTLSGVVSNCGNVTLTSVVVSDNVYGLVTSIPSLPPGAAQPYSKLVVNSCGNTPNLVLATGRSPCGTQVSATATITCSVDCPPCIRVDKQVACVVGANCGTFGKVATGMQGDNQNPAFCYRISITNCGSISLTNVQVLDDQLGDLTASYFAGPTTAFPVGATITRFFRAAWSTSTTNTVVTSGQSSLNGSGASATNAAVALVVQGSLTCSSMKASSPDDRDGNANDNHVSLRQDGLAHPVTFTITATSGDAPLVDVRVTSPALAALGCTLPTISLAANSSSNLTCTVLVNCSNLPGGTLNLPATISGILDGSGGACAQDTNGQPISVSSTNTGSVCVATIQCNPLSCLGDFVWEDLNRNGLQEAGEPGLSNVVVRLFACGSTAVLATQITSSDGYYSFCNLDAGSYQVQVLAPNRYQFTLPNVGTNDCLDSDANPVTSLTDCIALPGGVTNVCTDLGLFRPGTIGDLVWEDLNGNGRQDANEVGIANVPVRLYDCANNLLSSTTTGPTGAYLFTNLPPGGYLVGFGAPVGYQFTLANVGNDALDSDANAVTGFTSCDTLSSGETNLTVDAGLVRPGCIGDFVWDDFNRNGIQDGGEPGITNVTVWLQSCGNSNVLLTTVTDTSGHYQFCNAKPGTYQVTVMVPNGYRMTTNNATDECLDSDGLVTTTVPNPTNSAVTVKVVVSECVPLLSGTTNNCLDLGFHRPGAIGDYVWEDLKRNGLQDTNEVGVANVPVRLYDCANNLLASTSTGPTGAYLFTNLPPGGYVVGFAPPLVYQFTLRNAGNDALDSDANPGTGLTTCYTLGSGETNLTVDAGLARPVVEEPTGCLGDFVWDDRNRNGVQDPGEPGITNVTLWLQSCGTNDVVQTTVTGLNGLYQFCDLRPGPYQVTVVLPDGYRMTTNNATGDCQDSDGILTTTLPNPTNSTVTVKVVVSECATVASATTNSCLDLGFYRAGAIGDYVWEDLNSDGIQDTNEMGMAGVPVKLYDCRNNLLASTTTGPSGFYLFTNLPPGGYVVRFAAPVGYLLTLPNAGNDAVDSDANPTTGFTTCYTLGSGETNRTVDAGLVRDCQLQVVKTACILRPTGPCNPLNNCTPAYPFASANPLTSIVFNESEVLRSFTVSVTDNCLPQQIRVWYNDEHALTLGVRKVIVKTSAGTTTTDYPITPLGSSPDSALDPLVGATDLTGDEAGTDVSGRPMFPALFIADITSDPNSLEGDWQYGGTAIPPHAVCGTWKGAVRTVDRTRSPAVVTVTPDANPAKNNWNLGTSDPVPPGLDNEGYGAEIRWDVERLGLLPGHTYRLYFMVHDGDQNKTGGDVGHGCASLGVGVQSTCPPPPCNPLTNCTPPYPFASANPLTSIAFNESEVLRSYTVSVNNDCLPQQIRAWYNDEHALTLGVRRVIVKSAAGTTTTDYPITSLGSSPDSAFDPLVGATDLTGNEAGTDVSGRPMFPALFITDITSDPNSLEGDWQYGGTAIPPHAVFGTWKGAVRTVDQTKSPAVVTVTPDANPAKNNWNLGSSDPVPPGLDNEGYGAEVRWDVDRLGLEPNHTYRLYFMVHDGDQNKTGGDVGQGCAGLSMVCPNCPTGNSIAPLILTQPQYQTVATGGSATFSVVAFGSAPLSYQWQFNGTDLSGEINPSLVLDNIQPGQAGNYSVLVSNPAGSIVSSDAVLSVLLNLSCAVTPTTNQVCAGSSASFTVSLANAVAPYQIVWTGPAGFTAPSATITLANAQAANAGVYSVTVTDAQNRTTSCQGRLIVNPPPSCTVTPATNVVTVGVSASFTVTPSGGTEPYRVAWSGPNGFSSTNRTIQTSSAQLSNAGVYTVTVTDAKGCTSICQGRLIVNPVILPPSCVVTPATNTVCAGSPASFTLTVTNGTAPYQLAWSGPAGFSSANATITIASAQAANAGVYSVTVTDAQNRTTTCAGTLVVNPTPSCTVTPPTNVVNAGGSATFTVNPSGGTGQYSFAWSGPNGFSAISQTIILGNVQGINAGVYSVTVTDAKGCTTSCQGRLTINPSNVTQVRAGNVTATPNAPVLVPVEAVAQGTENAFGFSLQFDPTKLTLTGVALASGAPAGASLIPNTSQAANGRLGLLINLPAGATMPAGTQQLVVVSFQVANLTPIQVVPVAFSDVPIPRQVVDLLAQVQPASYTDGSVTVNNLSCAVTPATSEVCVGSPASFTITVANATAPYQIQWTGPAGFSSTDATITIASAQAANAGVYVATVTDAQSRTTSCQGQLLVNAAPSCTINPATNVVAPGSSASFTVNPSGGTAPYHVAWSGPSGFSSIDTTITIGNAGVYTVSVTDAKGCTSSCQSRLVLSLTRLLVGNVNAGPNGPALVPVAVVAEGTDNAFGFSLRFDPTKLTYTSVALASGAPAGAGLIVNASQAASGNLGLLINLPTGATLSPGTQQLVNVSFQVANLTPIQVVPVAFGDVPIQRQVVGASAQVLPATYSDGSVTVIAPGFEGDVVPRPDGDGFLTTADYVQLGRFAAGLDTVALGEFQRADCAPRSLLGDGRMTTGDWVQAGRYAAGLDPVTLAGGPTVPTSARPDPEDKGPKTSRTVTVSGTNAAPDSDVTLPVRLAAQGDENAVGFSVVFDPTRLTYTGATPGAGWVNNNINANAAGAGRVGVVMGLPIGQASPAGVRDVVLLKFHVAANATGSNLATFGDQPVYRDVIDVLANPVSATYVDGTVVFTAMPAPTVAVTLTGGNLVLTWGADSPGYEVETATNLTSGWTKVPTTPELVGNRYVLTLPRPAVGSQFYRLHK